MADLKVVKKVYLLVDPKVYLLVDPKAEKKEYL